MKKRIITIFILLFFQSAFSQEWPQFQHDASRTGKSTANIPPPYRVRWIWAGDDLTLRNQESEPGWTDNLTSINGYSLPIPDSVPHTISQQVQPVISGGIVYFGTQEGDALAIDSFDGTTLWKASIPGGILVSAAVQDGIVVFAGATGWIKAFDGITGNNLWSHNLKAAVTTAPCIAQNMVITANHKGRVNAFELTAGNQIWQKQLSAPITGGIAASPAKVFVPCEDMNVYALSLTSGSIENIQRVKGQGFRMTHPVISGQYLYITSALTPLMGSEYMMEDLMSASASLANEEDNIRLWLQGINIPGQWSDASVDWQHLFALDTTTFQIPYLIPCGPTEGCGYPPISPVIDQWNRTLCWWKTRYPKLTAESAFGTAFSVDICGINPSNGNRMIIDNGHLANIIQETDNLYAMSTGGKYLYLRQDFRGTQVINLENSTSSHIVAPIRNQDGGYWMADICYFDQSPPYNFKSGPVITRNQSVTGRTAPSLAYNLIFIAETFGIVAIEHDPSK